MAKKGARSKSCHIDVTARARELEALELRKKGMSYDAIGEALGISKSGAYLCVMRALESITKEAAEEADAVRQLELERLDAALVGLSTRIQHGDPAAVTAMIRVSERRARLLGLDKPTKSELTGADGAPLFSDEQTKAMAAAVLAQRGADERRDGDD